MRRRHERAWSSASGRAAPRAAFGKSPATKPGWRGGSRPGCRRSSGFRGAAGRLRRHIGGPAQEPTAASAACPRSTVYIPILIAFSIGMLALVYLPAPWSPTGSWASCAVCRPRRCPPSWVLAAQLVVQACLMVISILVVLIVSIAVFGASRSQEPGRVDPGVRAWRSPRCSRSACRSRRWPGAPTAARASWQRRSSPWCSSPGCGTRCSSCPAAPGRRPLHAARRGGAGDAGRDNVGFPPAEPLLVLAAYALVFGYLAKRFFRWE